MFTGLVLGKSKVYSVDKQKLEAGEAARLVVNCDFKELSEPKMGASVAINGVCLSIVQMERLSGEQRLLSFDVSPETMSLTNLSELSEGSPVHVEASLRFGDELGGHMVSGHVDSQAELVSLERVGEYTSMKLRTIDFGVVDVSFYLVPKGSVAVDGVSLTVNRVEDLGSQCEFEIMLIPETLKKTRFSELKAGDRVNIEADMMAKYLARYQNREGMLKT